ncbi:hypothetical protein STEG23_026247, partial [Scotinomys teguina]
SYAIRLREESGISGTIVSSIGPESAAPGTGSALELPPTVPYTSFRSQVTFSKKPSQITV